MEKWLLSLVLLPTVICIFLDQKSTTIVEVGEVVFVEKDVPSQLSCTHRCLRQEKNLIVVYKEDTGMCRCLRKAIDGNTKTIETDGAVVSERMHGVVNVALGKPAFQNGAYNDEEERCGAYRGTDGIFSIRPAVTKSYRGKFEVDLQRVVKIKYMVFHGSAYAFQQGHYKKLTFETKVAKSDEWKTCQYISEMKSASIRIECPESARYGRYARVNSDNGGQYLYTMEFEVYEEIF